MAVLMRYSCNVIYVPTAGGQPEGFGINIISDNAADACVQAVNQVKLIFPSAVAAWCDSIQQVSGGID